nr:MAG: hypothetical protein [Microvirus sp.]
MKWKIRVKDKRGNIHVHRFSQKVAAWEHYELYKRDIDMGYYAYVEMWVRNSSIVATGEVGEEVWSKFESYPEKD